MADYAFENLRWASSSLTWSYASANAGTDSSSPFSAAIGDGYKGYVQAAFDAWAGASGLSFTLVPDDPASADTADIRVGFGAFPDSQIGQTDYRGAAGQFVPGVVVRVQDPALTPLVPSDTGGLRYAPFVSEFQQVLIHELGHALGLGHSDDAHSVMYPTATAANRTLDGSDLAGIKALYPRAQSAPPAQSAEPTQPSAPVQPAGSGSFSVALTHDLASVVPGEDGSLHVSGPGIAQAAMAPGLYRIGFLDGTAVFDATGAAATAARLYQAAFGRIGDAGGIAYWAEALRAGASPLDAARAFAGSAEMAARGLSDAGFVAAVYRDGLGRAPDPGGLQSFVQALSAGGERARVLLDIAQSAEAKAHLRAAAGDPAEAEAYRLYDTVLGRAPDAGGLAYTGDLIARGATAAEVARSMLAGPESTSRYGQSTDRDFVATLYRNGLDREPDAGGLAWAQGLLAQGTSRAQLAAGFADGAEARQLTAAATHDGWVWLG